VTAFPEKSQEAGRNGKEKGEVPLNLLVFPPSCESGRLTERARHGRSLTEQTPKEAKEVSDQI
jgi:hypothetical protein